MKAFIILILSVPAMLSITAPWLNENVTDVSKLEGDIVTGDHPHEESTDQCQHCQHAGVPTRSTKLWDNQTIPYMISKRFNARHKAIILLAIAEIQDQTCVKFVERTTHINHIFFNWMGANGACSSEVGRVGKRQYVNLTEACATHNTVLHELAHVLGFYHEHNRYDRDKFIQVIWENVDEERKNQYKIIRQPEILFVEYNISYDYSSITHYPEYSNSVNGEKTILSRQSFGIIPKSAGLSHFDVIKINLLYNCEDLIPDKENIVPKEEDHQEVENSIEHAETTIKQVQTTSSTAITETSTGTTSKMTTSTVTRPISVLNNEIIAAVEEGNETRVEQLLNEGADVNAILYYAAGKGHVNVVSLLLDKGANIEARDAYAWTPLHYAARHGHANVVSLLLDKGADIETRSTSNQTPLHDAAQKGHMNVVSLLLDKGANIEARNTYNSTPLYFAASGGNANVVSLLLDKGANIFAKDIYNETPLDFARKINRVPEIVKILERKQRQLITG